MIIQKWEGCVEHIDKFADEFGATLRDITDPNNPDEYSTFKISDLPERVQDKLELGLYFNWTITVNDQGIGKSSIQFSEEKWTADEIAKIHEEARRRAEALDIPYPPPPSI